MKILIVNTSDLDGGAAKAAYRLHEALINDGIDSQMLVQTKRSDNYTILSENQRIKKIFNKMRPLIDALPLRYYKNKTKTLFSPSLIPSFGIVEKINEINADIVHLHWICASMIKIEDLAKIKAPIVWTLHDMWAFTGGCHYNEDCNEYQKNCGNCKILGSHKEIDLSRKVYNRKKNTFSTINNITIIGVSKWLTNCSKNSTLFKEKESLTLPNPLNTDLFKPLDKEKARELWNLPKNKKLILFGAIGGTNDLRKGFKELSEALKEIQSREIEFVIFGSSEPKNSQNFGFKTHYLGHLHDEVSLVTLYSAVDVMIVPSLQEAFGQTASEAMACGTPVVAFGHTGLLDIIDHKINGYLAKSFDTNDLAKGIDWILNNENYDELSENAREKIVKEFDNKIVVEKYLELYNKILKN